MGFAPLERNPFWVAFLAINISLRWSETLLHCVTTLYPKAVRIEAAFKKFRVQALACVLPARELNIFDCELLTPSLITHLFFT